jgi:hypothetical protein
VAATVRFSLTVRSSNSSTEPAPRPRVRRQPVELRAGQFHGAPGPDEAGHRVDEGGLARAVRPDQADEFARLDLQVNPGHSPHAAEADRNAARAKDGSHRRKPYAGID